MALKFKYSPWWIEAGDFSKEHSEAFSRDLKIAAALLSRFIQGLELEARPQIQNSKPASESRLERVFISHAC